MARIYFYEDIIWFHESKVENGKRENQVSESKDLLHKYKHISYFPPNNQQ
jgi:hypothetical protein